MKIDKEIQEGIPVFEWKGIVEPTNAISHAETYSDMNLKSVYMPLESLRKRVQKEDDARWGKSFVHTISREGVTISQPKKQWNFWSFIKSLIMV